MEQTESKEPQKPTQGKTGHYAVQKVDGRKAIGTCNGLASWGSRIWSAEHLGLGRRWDTGGGAVQEGRTSVY